MSTLGIAISIAASAFAEKKDKAGEPYILHCLRVMNKLHSKDKELQTIAVLHDLLEDCSEDWCEQDLVELKFSHRVVAALVLLNHKTGVPYMDYIKALSHNEDARLVKLADLKDNSDISRLKGLTKKDFDRMEKYHTAYIYLSSI